MNARTRSGVVALLALAAACESTEPTGLQLDIALDKDVVAITDSVRLTLTLSNASSRAIRVLPADAYGYCTHAFRAYDAQGREVTPPYALCFVAASLVAHNPVELGPLERMTITDWWVVGQSHIDLHPLTPGVYRVRGYVNSVDSPERTVEVIGN